MLKIINYPIQSHIISVEGFTGKDCDKAIVPCDENPCQNGAVCLLEDERPVCYCVPDYHGVLCELKYDDCESKFAHCDNGGTCVDGVNSFTCSCSPGYSGPMCEYESFPTSTSSVETEETSDHGTSLSKTTISVAKDLTSVFSSSTSSFTTYSTTSRPSILPYTKKSTVTEKTASTLAYEDGGPLSASSAETTAALPTDVPSTGFTGQDDISELITSAATDGYTHATETRSTEVYLPTGRSIHDGEVTKEPGDYDQTTMYPVFSDRTDEDATRATEYMTSSR